MAQEPGQEKRDPPSNEDKPSRGRLIWFAIAVAILLVVLLLVWVNPSDPTEKKDFIQAVGVLLAALAGLGGLYFTSQNLKQTRQDTERQLQQARDSTKDQLQQARESQEQNQRLTEQGQITERFTRAIDQLGNSSLEVRMGGIYALERIAKESEEDYWPIMEVLTAYVRKNARRKKEEAEASKGGDSESVLGLPDPDIEAVCSVIRRRDRYYGRGEDDRLELSGTNLQAVLLEGAELTRANLSGADLRRANLEQATLTRADLYKADLGPAHLKGANLNEASLYEVNLSGANLTEASLKDTVLADADLSGATLVRVDFTGANLRGAALWGADISGANLKEAKRLLQEQIDQTTGSVLEPPLPELPEGIRLPEGWGLR
jgi:uncharacterized protein YjbI with pentapeptide repeats